MARVSAVVLSFLLAVVHAASLDDPSSSLPGIEDLTPDNFDEIVTRRKHALVEFYAPWCGHCKKMTPEYKKLGEMVAADPKLKSRVVLGKVNADTHRALGSQYEVSGFPTIKYFPRGRIAKGPESYSGPRTADAFLAFLKKKLAEDEDFARVEELDILAKKAVSSDNLEAVYKEMEAAVGKLGEDKAEYGQVYLTVLKKASEKGSVKYFQTEHDRLHRMLDTGNVAEQRADEMNRKVSVLSAFLPDTAVEE